MQLRVLNCTKISVQFHTRGYPCTTASWPGLVKVCQHSSSLESRSLASHIHASAPFCQLRGSFISYNCLKTAIHKIRATLFLPTTVHSFRILILKACMYTSAKTVQHQVAMTSRWSFMKLCSPATIIDCKVLRNKSWCN